MRLLKFDSNGELSLTEFFGENIPPYAILSHTWGPPHDEVSFRDVVEGKAKFKKGYQKILLCKNQVAHDGLEYFWVDTCVIDKSSSAELSEAINSMFKWYRNAAVCYVYLADVVARTSTWTNSSSLQLYFRAPEDVWRTAFRNSRWFTRGWTLQELIAPHRVVFFDSGTNLYSSSPMGHCCVGSRHSLIHEIHEITGIPIPVLQGISSVSQYPVEEVFSWTANRQTTREEDAAYSLLGLFDVSMPPIYGEGVKRAFRRLHREIRESREEEESTVLQAPQPFSQRQSDDPNGGAVFHGPISGRYVIPGARVTGGTMNFNFPGGTRDGLS